MGRKFWKTSLCVGAAVMTAFSGGSAFPALAVSAATETEAAETGAAGTGAAETGAAETAVGETETIVSAEVVSAADLNADTLMQQEGLQSSEKWWTKIEAESGALEGTAKTELLMSVGWAKVVSFLDKGEANAVTLSVQADFEDDVQMTVRYRSGDERNLCYKVNGGAENKITGLNSGGWNSMKDAPAQTIHLTQGNNTIRFYAAANENGPGLDYITLSRNGATEDDMNPQEVTVKFMADGKQQGDSRIKLYSDSIQANEVPADPVKEGVDFLGWYWGPNSKYEAMFPLKLSDIPKDVRKKLNNEIVFTARYGHHTPANPVEKEGYRLIFQDEFDKDALDQDKWVDHYLSSWSTTADNTMEWTESNGIMNIQIKETTEPWCREYDGATVVSGFTTGQRNGLHNWNGNNQVRNPKDTELTHINQYGYYEMRAKGQSGSSRHSAWWLLGFEDVPEESAEIDIFEIKGKDGTRVPPALHKWNDSDAFGGSLSTYADTSRDFNNEYHVYGFDWQKGTSGDTTYPDKIVLYVDGKEVSSVKVNIDYPMIQLLSLYEKREGGWTGAWEWMPYPNSFEVDYVRVYKKLPNGQQAIPENELKVESIQAENLWLSEEEMQLKTYEGGYTEKQLPGTKSYVRVTWNDGVETQEPVQWEPVTEEELSRLRSGEIVTKTGFVPGINQNATMQISTYLCTLENITCVRGNADLKYAFDGKINESTMTPSGEFKAGDFSNDKAAMIYDFKKDVALNGLNIWCNYGNDQGIKKIKVAAWDAQEQNWNTIKDENGNDREFTFNWQTAVQAAEMQSIHFNTVNTQKVKIIVLDAGYKWGKFSVREMEFLTEN